MVLNFKYDHGFLELSVIVHDPFYHRSCNIPEIDRYLFIVQSSDFTKSQYCVSLSVKHNLEMFCEKKEITFINDMVEMNKIM